MEKAGIDNASVLRPFSRVGTMIPEFQEAVSLPRVYCWRAEENWGCASYNSEVGTRAPLTHSVVLWHENGMGGGTDRKERALSRRGASGIRGLTSDP